jgi:hypothetical protein
LHLKYELIFIQNKTFSIYSNCSHLEWMPGLSDSILKGDHPSSIPNRFGLIQFSGFRGKDLNVKVYDIRWTDRRASKIRP